MIPEFVANGLEALVSIQRIEKYLAAPNCERYVREGDDIVFKDASITWPSDSTDRNNNERFFLHDCTFEVPRKELTIIIGPTGSGKSLLLASIVGEADLSSGIIEAPQNIPAEHRYDKRANRTDWIIESAIAFVAQIPWIENATIKDNILFGLPYDRGRYNKVIESCALRRDLNILEAGDETDIGFNGINLSGGQKWRITFARALYSRAGILILDDIFRQVVDAT